MPNRVVVRALGAWMQSTAAHVVLNRLIDLTSNFYPQARAIAFLVPIAASVAGFVGDTITSLMGNEEEEVQVGVMEGGENHNETSEDNCQDHGNC